MWGLVSLILFIVSLLLSGCGIVTNGGLVAEPTGAKEQYSSNGLENISFSPAYMHTSISPGQQMTSFLDDRGVDNHGDWDAYYLENAPIGSKILVTVTGHSAGDFDLFVWRDGNYREQENNSRSNVQIELVVGDNTWIVVAIESGRGSYRIVVHSPSNDSNYAIPGPFNVHRFEWQNDMDGDSFVMNETFHETNRVRYLGINSSELPDECMARRAAERNFDLISRNNNQVWIEVGKQLRDVHKRLLAWVFLDGNGRQMLNEILVREGLAKAFKDPLNTKYDNTFINAQIDAAFQQRGRWAPISRGGCEEDGYSNSEVFIPVAKYWGSDRFVVVGNRGSSSVNIADYRIQISGLGTFGPNSFLLPPGRIVIIEIAGLPDRQGNIAITKEGLVLHKYTYVGF